MVTIVAEPEAGAAASATAKDEDKTIQAKTRPEREATMKDYFRVFSYAKKLDYALIGFGVIASIGAGVTLPLMNIVFGQLVGEFNDFATVDSTQN